MRHVLSIIVDNNPGVLIRIAGLFSRRGYNIDSLTVGDTHDPCISRMTVVVRGDDSVIEQITKQLEKLIDVKKVKVVSNEPSVYRELALIKVNSEGTKRAELLSVAEIFRANIVDVSHDSLMLEVTGDEGKIMALLELCTPFGLIEVIRTGLTSLQRGSSSLQNE